MVRWAVGFIRMALSSKKQMRPLLFPPVRPILHKNIQRLDDHPCKCVIGLLCISLDPLGQPAGNLDAQFMCGVGTLVAHIVIIHDVEFPLKFRGGNALNSVYTGSFGPGATKRWRCHGRCFSPPGLKIFPPSNIMVMVPSPTPTALTTPTNHTVHPTGYNPAQFLPNSVPLQLGS